MYNKALFGIVLFCSIGLSGLSAKVNSDSLKEKYIPKVIINAKWGDGPGEFGIIHDPYELSPGPCGLTVKNERIYLWDGVHYRINVYSLAGSFLYSIELKNYKYDIGFIASGGTALEMDDEGNFYLLGYDSPSGGSKILKFDSTGNFVKELCKSPIDEEEEAKIESLPFPYEKQRKLFASLLQDYYSKGEDPPHWLKAKYDTLDSLARAYKLQDMKREPIRFAFESILKIKGDTLITAIESKERGIVYIDKNSGKILKEVKKTKEAKERVKKWWYPEDYPDVIKNGIGLKGKLKKFVLDARGFTQTLSAHGFDKEGNFYELLWGDWGNFKGDWRKNKGMGIKVIKWEKVK